MQSRNWISHLITIFKSKESCRENSRMSGIPDKYYNNVRKLHDPHVDPPLLCEIPKASPSAQQYLLDVCTTDSQILTPNVPHTNTYSFALYKAQSWHLAPNNQLLIWNTTITWQQHDNMCVRKARTKGLCNFAISVKSPVVCVCFHVWIVEQARTNRADRMHFRTQILDNVNGSWSWSYAWTHFRSFLIRWCRVTSLAFVDKLCTIRRNILLEHCRKFACFEFRGQCRHNERRRITCDVGCRAAWVSRTLLMYYMWQSEPANRVGLLVSAWMNCANSSLFGGWFDGESYAHTSVGYFRMVSEDGPLALITTLAVPSAYRCRYKNANDFGLCVCLCVSTFDCVFGSTYISYSHCSRCASMRFDGHGHHSLALSGEWSNDIMGH